MPLGILGGPVRAREVDEVVDVEEGAVSGEVRMVRVWGREELGDHKIYRRLHRSRPRSLRERHEQISMHLCDVLRDLQNGARGMVF